MLFRVVSVFMVLGALAGGCGDADTAEVAPTTTASTTTTTAPATTTVAPTTTTATTTTTTTALPQLTFSTPPTEQELIALANAYWQTLHEASQTSDTSHPGLDLYLTDPLLARVRQVFNERTNEGLISIDPDGQIDPHEFRVLTIEDDFAIVEDCTIDDGQITEQATGVVLDGTVLHRHLQLELTSQGDKWKIANQYRVWEGPPEEPCPGW